PEGGAVPGIKPPGHALGHPVVVVGLEERQVLVEDLLGDPLELGKADARIDAEVPQRAIEALEELLEPEDAGPEGPRRGEDRVAVLEATIPERDPDIPLGDDPAVEVGDTLGCRLCHCRSSYRGHAMWCGRRSSSPREVSVAEGDRPVNAGCDPVDGSVHGAAAPAPAASTRRRARAANPVASGRGPGGAGRWQAPRMARATGAPSAALHWRTRAVAHCRTPLARRCPDGESGAASRGGTAGGADRAVPRDGCLPGPDGRAWPAERGSGAGGLCRA